MNGPEQTSTEPFGPALICRSPVSIANGTRAPMPNGFP
jgi:hypothetical protein